MALRIYVSDIAIILLISKASTRWRGNLKGLFTREIYQMTSAKQTSLDSPFKYSYVVHIQAGIKEIS